MNTKKHTLASQLNRILDGYHHPGGFNWPQFWIIASAAVLIVQFVALQQSWKNERELSRQINQLHQQMQK